MSVKNLKDYFEFLERQYKPAKGLSKEEIDAIFEDNASGMIKVNQSNNE